MARAREVKYILVNPLKNLNITIIMISLRCAHALRRSYMPTIYVKKEQYDELVKLDIDPTELITELLEGYLKGLQKKSS